MNLPFIFTVITPKLMFPFLTKDIKHGSIDNFDSCRYTICVGQVASWAVRDSTALLPRFCNLFSKFLQSITKDYSSYVNNSIIGWRKNE